MKVKALVEWPQTAQRDGAPLADDPRTRRTIAQAVTQLEVARMLQRRVISEALKDRVPTVESSQYKLYMNELGQRVANWALDVIGAAGALRAGEAEAPVGGRFERSYRYTVVDTIGGGTSEIQRNIIARRGLGLPISY
jgi:alkylation response protein AidB-like acyl-CoA dehydrogenase